MFKPLKKQVSSYRTDKAPKLATAFRRKLLKVTLLIVVISIVLVTAALTAIVTGTTAYSLSSQLVEIDLEVLSYADFFLGFGNPFIDIWDYKDTDYPYMGHYTELPVWYRVDENGVIFDSSRPETIGKNVSEYPRLADMHNSLMENFPVPGDQNGEETAIVDPLKSEDFKTENWTKLSGVRVEGGTALFEIPPSVYYYQMDNAVERVCMYRAVGSSGFNILVRQDGTVVSLPMGMEEDMPEKVDVEKILKLSEENKVFTYDILGKTYYAMYRQIDGYYGISAVPRASVLSGWYALLAVIAILVVVLMVIVFLRVNILTRRLIVDNIGTINSELSEITGGDLDTQIDVTEYIEFRELSEGINTTVAALKGYIAKEGERFEKELELARSIQTSALPNVFPPYPDRGDVDIFASMTPAKEVGGDFYDFFFVDSTHLAFLTADVSDKGIPAAMFMMKAKTMIKSLAQSSRNVDEVIYIANNALCDNNEADMFVTLWCGILDTETGAVSYVNAGHCKPLLLRADGQTEYLDQLPDFVMAGEEGVTYRLRQTVLGKGDAIFLYTDGVTEAMDADDVLYGEDRLKSVLAARKDINVRELCERVRDDVRGFSDGVAQADDMTMLAVVYNGSAREEITVEAKTENLYEVYGFLEERVTASGFDDVTAAQLGIAADEICANIVRYAYPHGTGPLTVGYEFRAASGEAVITFTDSGIPFNPLNVAEPDTTNVEDSSEGGFGVFLVRKFSDKLLYEYRDEKNILTIIKRIE